MILFSFVTGHYDTWYAVGGGGTVARVHPQVLGSGPDQAKKIFHPFWVGLLLPDLAGKGESLT